jgi:hypothetical protein
MKAGIADPEKISIARQCHCKHVSAVTNNHATTEKLLEVMFSMLSFPRLYKENKLEFLISQKCESVEKSAVICGWEVPAGRDVSTEPEESPLLKAVTMQFLAKSMTS